MRKGMKAMLLALVLATTPSLLAAEPPPQGSSPEALARQMIELTGGVDSAKETIKEVTAAIKQQDMDVPAEFWDEFFAGVDPNRMIELVIPVYVRNFTVEEMTAAIEFYSSPAGKSITRKLPLIAEESEKVGEAWGAELALQAVERLAKYEQEHPKG